MTPTTTMSPSTVMYPISMTIPLPPEYVVSLEGGDSLRYRGRLD